MDRVPLKFATLAGIVGNSSGNGRIVDEGGSTLTLSNSNTYTGTTTITGDSTLIVGNGAGPGSATGSSNISIPSGSTLAGSGLITGAVTIASGGILAPGLGSTPGIISTGNLTLSSGSNLDCVINGSTAGTGYSQVEVFGTVSVSGAYLNLSGSRHSHPGDILTLIANIWNNTLTGTFSSISQGASLTVNSVTYLASYTGGSGKSVTLTDDTPPVAYPDSYPTNENATLTVNAANGVLSNDYGSNLSVYSINGQTGYVGTQVTTSVGGKLTLNPDGSFTYIPHTGYVGTDSWAVYLITDGVNQSVTAVPFTVVVNPGHIGVTGASFSANTNIDTGTITVATYTDSAWTGSSPDTYTASINWGDGHITGGLASGGVVTADHTYTSAGTFTVTTTVTNTTNGATNDDSGQTPRPSATVTLLAPPTPSAPSASLSSGSIALTWSADLNAASYTVLRSDNGGTYAALSGGTGITGTSFTDTTVVAGDTYAYELKATDTSGTSSASAASGPITLAPPAPSSLSATPGTNQITLSWPTANGAVYYNIYELESGTYTLLSPPVTSGTSVIETGLTAGASYSFEVSAVNAGGESGRTAPASAVPIAAAPASLTVAPGDTDAFLTWPASAGASYYNIYRNDGTGFVNVGSSEVGYTDTGLTDGASYNYEVTAVNAGGESAPSPSASVTPSAAVFQNVTVTAASTSEIDLGVTSLPLRGLGPD